jgi:hypothetical protein
VRIYITSKLYVQYLKHVTYDFLAFEWSFISRTYFNQ